MKRLFDLALATAGLAVAAPLLLAISLVIIATDGLPVCYLQKRVGKHGRPFLIWKFRTMIRNADRIGGPLTTAHDPRITRIGRLLRKTKLDELPQLWNVIRGEMSFVGPRPESPLYVEKYSDAQREVLSLTPGITDPASIAFFDESDLFESEDQAEKIYLEEVMPEKIRLNLAYAERATLIADAGVIWATLKRMAA